MTALLRIELFGNAEYEWKADEKRIAADLLRLGPETYEFMRDEWRIRLPPASTTSEWMEELPAEVEAD